MPKSPLTRRLDRLEPPETEAKGPDRIEIVGIDPQTGREVGPEVTIHVRR